MPPTVHFVDIIMFMAQNPACDTCCPTLTRISFIHMFYFQENLKSEQTSCSLQVKSVYLVDWQSASVDSTFFAILD